ncbi:hypothetical protein AQS8620_02141 [Aquimixticola soesokkakensis]|uniref:DUF560 domain-containing protein n=1 Tax=Aquimixticola soesokkakensis TaxID=1519096 RepID=A0A1Y5SWR1_9RHOB|nr:hypothetical protein [Aquimixticola soesokkakensis]SLN49815.1 hypothetical protein AQS8620_02141 [Aquimixticola soesokkakensis]
MLFNRSDRHRSCRLARPIRSLVLCATLGLGALPAQATEPLRLSPVATLQLGGESLANGDARTALFLANAYLDNIGESFLARFLQARAAGELGTWDTALIGAKRAYALASTDGERRNSARLAGRAAAKLDRNFSSKIWLRRAFQNSATPFEKARDLADFRIIDARDPITRHISFGIAPNSNINNGAQSPALTIDGYPDLGWEISNTGQALSGTTASIDAALGFQIARRERTRLSLGVHGATRLNRLSKSARALAPMAKGSDFDTSLLGLRFDLVHLLALGAQPYQISLYTDASTQNFGHRPYKTALTVGGQVQTRVGTATQGLAASLSRETAQRADTPARFVLRASPFVAVKQPGGTLTVTANVEQVRSAARAQQSFLAGGSVSFDLAENIGPLHLRFGVAAYRRETPHYAQFPFGEIEGGRSDMTTSAQINATFSDTSYYGFSPELGLVYRHTNSNVSRYDTSEIGLGLSFRSAF